MGTEWKPVGERERIVRLAEPALGEPRKLAGAEAAPQAAPVRLVNAAGAATRLDNPVLPQAAAKLRVALAPSLAAPAKTELTRTAPAVSAEVRAATQTVNQILKRGDRTRLTPADLKKVSDMMDAHEYQGKKNAISALDAYDLATLKSALPALEALVQGPKAPESTVFTHFLFADGIRDYKTRTAAEFLANRYGNDRKEVSLTDISDAQIALEEIAAFEVAKVAAGTATVNPNAYLGPLAKKIVAAPKVVTKESLDAISLYMHSGKGGLTNWGPALINGHAFDKVFHLAAEPTLTVGIAPINDGSSDTAPAESFARSSARMRKTEATQDSSDEAVSGTDPSDDSSASDDLSASDNTSSSDEANTGDDVPGQVTKPATSQSQRRTASAGGITPRAKKSASPGSKIDQASVPALKEAIIEYERRFADTGYDRVYMVGEEDGELYVAVNEGGSLQYIADIGQRATMGSTNRPHQACEIVYIGDGINSFREATLGVATKAALRLGRFVNRLVRGEANTAVDAAATDIAKGVAAAKGANSNGAIASMASALIGLTLPFTEAAHALGHTPYYVAGPAALVGVSAALTAFQWGLQKRNRTLTPFIHSFAVPNRKHPINFH